MLQILVGFGTLCHWRSDARDWLLVYPTLFVKILHCIVLYFQENLNFGAFIWFRILGNTVTSEVWMWRINIKVSGVSGKGSASSSKGGVSKTSTRQSNNKKEEQGNAMDG